MLANEIDRLYLLIGRIATEFSSIETIWYLIFTTLIPQTPRPAVDAIFQQIRTGHQQRQLIVSVAEAVLPKDSDALLTIKELAVKTRAVAERRNAALHSAIYIMEAAIPPHIAAMGTSKRSPLADRDIQILKCFPLAFMFAQKPWFGGLPNLLNFVQHRDEEEIELPILMRARENHQAWPAVPHGNTLMLMAADSFGFIGCKS
jgi:hypothetical protein